MIGCKGEVIAAYKRNGDPIVSTCGTYWGGEKLLCMSCLQEAHKLYPQGWTGYPGDTCKHGVYVGGCGEDHMCFQCEME